MSNSSKNSCQHPKVGVGVIVMRDGKILIGKRKGAHGEGAWAFPGGHLHFGENWEECARREVEEETSLVIKDISVAYVTNDVFHGEEKHYITVFMKANHISGEPENREPNRCEGWEWHAWDALPTPHFIPFENLLTSEYMPF